MDIPYGWALEIVKDSMNNLVFYLLQEAYSVEKYVNHLQEALDILYKEVRVWDTLDSWILATSIKCYLPPLASPWLFFIPSILSK